MAGATVSLDGDNSRLNAKADESKKKIKAIGDEGGKAIQKGFDEGTVALGKMVVAAYALKKAMEAAAGLRSRIDAAEMANSEKYGGGKLRATIAGTKAGLAPEDIEKFLRSKGKLSYEERIGAVESFGNDPMAKFLKPKNILAALNLKNQGLNTDAEVDQAAKIGPAYAQRLANERLTKLPPEQRAEYNIEKKIATVGAIPTDYGSEGRLKRLTQEYGRLDRRRNIEAYEFADTLSPELGKMKERVQGAEALELQSAMDRALAKHRLSIMKPTTWINH